MDYIFVILFFVFGYLLKYNFKSLNTYDHRILDILFFYHMIMSFVFFLYIISFKGDAIGYWNFVKYKEFPEILDRYARAHDAFSVMWMITYLPSKILGLSLYTGMFMFGTIGYYGVLLLYLTIKELFPLNQFLNRSKILNFSVFPTLLFLPNFHFWSSGVGKDTLVFFAVAAMIYSLNAPKRRILYLLIGIIITYFLRPHITLIFFAAFGLAFMLKSNLLAAQKVFIGLIALAVFLPLLSKVLAFAHIEEASLEGFQEFSENKSTALSKTAETGINLSSLPYPLQVLTFLFRPLFFDARSALGLLASVESFAWLVLTINFLTHKPKYVFKKSSFIILGSFIYWLLGALAFAPVMSNLGIIVRERNMFLPAFVLFAVAGIGETKRFKKFEWFYYKKKKELEEAQSSKEF